MRVYYLLEHKTCRNYFSQESAYYQRRVEKHVANIHGVFPLYTGCVKIQPWKRKQVVSSKESFQILTS